jgi:hypothetical protein
MFYGSRENYTWSITFSVDRICPNWNQKNRGHNLTSCYFKLGLLSDSRDSVVGIATGYGLDDRGVGVRVPVRSRIFSSPRHPERFWGPPNLISNGYRGLFPRRENGRGVRLTIHLQLVPRSRKCELYIHSPIRLHGVVLN